MKIKYLKLLLLLILVLVYNYFFWKEKFGLNLTIFSWLIIISTLYFYSNALKFRVVCIFMAFTLITSITVVLNNSFISFFGHISSLLVLIGYIHESKLKSIFYSVGFSLTSLGLSWINVILIPFQTPKKFILKNSFFKKILSYAKLIVIPLFFVIVFFVIFQFANPIFLDWTEYVGEVLGDVIVYVFEQISIAKLSFIYFGLVICTYFLFRWDLPYFLKKEQSKSNHVKRIRKKKSPHASIIHYPMALKNEYKMALMLVFMVNILLLVVNIIDIDWLWFNFHYRDIENFATLVHEGTYALIFSIVLSMAIMLYYFRANLNFYTKNIWLKRLCYIWIFQNIILLISVVLRTYYYIHERGLAYKRIGVLIYLTLTLFGLLTLYLKISKKKSMYYLLKTNAWGVYVMMIFMAVINWDIIIIKYNIQHYRKTKVIDMEFMMTRSNKTLMIIDENREYLPMNNSSWLTDELTYSQYLKKRVKYFKRKQKSYSWVSWNYQDDKSLRYFSKK